MTELSNIEKKVESQANQQPGEILRALREQKGMSKKDIGAALNLPERFIDYLEMGDFDKLPGHTFARGYIKNYAKFLEVENAEELVAVFDNYTGTNALGSSVNNLQQIKQIKHFSNNIYWLISFVIVLIVIGIVFVWWQSRPNTVAGSIDNSPIVVEATPTSSTTTDPSTTQLTIPLSNVDSDNNTNAQNISADTETSVNNSDNSATNQTPTDITPAQQPTVNNVQGEGSLEAKFTANCWLTVNDSTGKTLVSKLMTKGSNLTIKGKPPLEVILGAPNAASLTYNGQAVSINAKPGATHRLKLGQ